MAEAEAGLTQYLKDMRRTLGKGASYVSVNKDAYLLEVPQVTLLHGCARMHL